MLSFALLVAALLLGQVVLLVPVADFLTRNVTGEPATRRGIRAAAGPFHSAA